MQYAYDDVADSILVFAKKPDEQVKGSATVANLVLDFTKDGKVVGLEIRKATEFLNTLGIEKTPSDIRSASLEVQYRGDGFVIFVKLKFEDSEQKVPIFISAESPHFAIA